MTLQFGASLTDDYRIVIYDRNMFICKPLILNHQKVMSQFGASLTDDSRIVIDDHNMFIIQAADLKSECMTK